MKIQDLKTTNKPWLCGKCTLLKNIFPRQKYENSGFAAIEFKEIELSFSL